MEKAIEFGQKINSIQYIERIGIYAIIKNNKDEIAVIKAANGYFLPGGGQKDDENHEQCLIRETSEELGWKIQIKDYVGNANRYFFATTKNDYYHSVGYFYNAVIIDKNGHPSEPDHELVWLTIDEVKEKLFHEHQIWAVFESFVKLS